MAKPKAATELGMTRKMNAFAKLVIQAWQVEQTFHVGADRSTNAICAIHVDGKAVLTIQHSHSTEAIGAALAVLAQRGKACPTTANQKRSSRSSSAATTSSKKRSSRT